MIWAQLSIASGSIGGECNRITSQTPAQAPEDWDWTLSSNSTENQKSQMRFHLHYVFVLLGYRPDVGRGTYDNKQVPVWRNDNRLCLDPYWLLPGASGQMWPSRSRMSKRYTRRTHRKKPCPSSKTPTSTVDDVSFNSFAHHQQP